MGLGHQLSKFMYIYDFLVALFVMLIDKDRSCLGQVAEQESTNLGSAVTIANAETLVSLTESLDIEVSWFNILVDNLTSLGLVLSHSFSKGLVYLWTGILLSLLLFGLGFTTLFIPVREMTSSINIVPW